jgi:putative ABC transport system permease protein
MPPLRELGRRLLAPLRRRRLERDLEDEIAFHIAMRETEYRQSGVTPEEAELAARRRFGNVPLVKEETRDTWSFPSVESVRQDVRFAARSLLRAPGFTLLVVLTVALAIGITTAMFTLVDALILRPVPFRAPDELAFVYMGNERGGRTFVAPAVLRAWRGSPAFANVEGARSDTALVEHEGVVLARGIARVTPGLFSMLGNIAPVRGRLFDPTDGRAGSDDRVLISEDLWRTVYNADADLIGTRITVGSEALLVVGILPSDFRFPRWDTVIWRAIDFMAVSTYADFPMAYVRFAPNVPRPDALRIATEAARAADARNAKVWPRLRPLANIDPYYQRAVPLLAGGVLLVFFVLCANVSGLLLARLTERRREFSMRSVLGAARGRIIRQAFVENSVIGLLGVALGIALSWGLVSLARGFLPEAFLLRTLNPLNLDMRALGIASAFGVLATLAAGLLPAWIGTRIDPLNSVRVSERTGTESRAARVVARSLLVAETTVACTLLVGATLLVRSFVNLANAERGLESDGVITAWISLPSSDDGNQQRRLLTRLIEDDVRQLPGVQQVVWSGALPPSGAAHSHGIWQSDAAGSPAVEMSVKRYPVGPDFFDFYGIPILRGRTFAPTDSERAVIVGERLARALWLDEDPVGRTFRFEKERFDVIGVAREIHHPSLSPSIDTPEFYERFTADHGYSYLNIRCGSVCPDVALVRKTVGTVHVGAGLHQVHRLEDVYFEQIAQPRAAAALGFAFAAISIVAAAGGLFSVLRYAVTRRRREFGVRTALGASPAQISRMVFRDGFTVTSLGIVFGAIAASSLGQFIASLQYGVTVSDPLSWTVVLGLLALTTMAATWSPARDAVRVDPVVLLRDE